MKKSIWMADFDFQTPGWTFFVFLHQNEKTESVSPRFPPKMGNSSTPNINHYTSLMKDIIGIW